MIDRELTYYRVIHTREGYYSDAQERFDARTNLAESDEVDLEFDTLEGIGHWLFLGTEIQSPRIPGDAQVERNNPLGQGGCYAFSSNRLRILETLSIGAWLGRLGTRYDGGLHVKDIILAPGAFVSPSGELHRRRPPGFHANGSPGPSNRAMRFQSPATTRDPESGSRPALFFRGFPGIRRTTIRHSLYFRAVICVGQASLSSFSGRSGRLRIPMIDPTRVGGQSK